MFIAVGLLWTTTPAATAQITGGFDEPITSGTSYHVFAFPGEPTVTVHLLGDIASGVYVVGAGISLLELLSVAGGAVRGQGGGDRSSFTVRVFRTTGARRTSIYEADMHQLLREPTEYPALRDGDVITVDSTVRQRISFFNLVNIATSVSTVVLLVLRLVEGR